MQSVKAALSCIGASGGTRSVLGDLFGFFLRRVPTDPDTSVTASVSLTSHLQSLSGRHLHINVISVGFDARPAADQQTDLERIDYCIYRTRNIYQPVSLGIGRVQHWEISAAAAGGRDDIGSDDEADDLTDEWTVQNNGIDVFLVRNISANFIGTSPVPGDCDKDDKDDGLIGGEIGGNHEQVSRTFAHEIGHFLNLSHNHGDRPACPTTTAGQNNLMAQTRCALSERNSVLLSSGQGSTVRGRCQVRAGC